MTRDEFYNDLRKYNELGEGKEEIVLAPQLDENTDSYLIDGHYFWCNRWSLERIVASGVKTHTDFGSQTSFIGLMSIFCKIKHYDIRNVVIDCPNIDFSLKDVTDTGLESDSISSLSCLHVAEHIGLGRYGDGLDPQGTIKACKELGRILEPGGNLYFALPVGKEVVCFNSHRIVDPRRIVDAFKGLKLIELCGSHVYETAPVNETNYIENVDIEELSKSRYACGMFRFTK